MRSVFHSLLWLGRNHPVATGSVALGVALATAGLGQNAHKLYLVHLGFGLAYLLIFMTLIWVIDALRFSRHVPSPSADSKPPAIALFFICLIGIVLLISAILFHVDKVASLKNGDVKIVELPGKEIVHTITTGSPPTISAPSKPMSGPLLMQVTFKDSPLLTIARRKRIIESANGTASYFKNLGIPVPSEVPPIGVDTTAPKGKGWSFNQQGDEKIYYDKFMLQIGTLDSPKVITQAFGAFIVGRFLYKPLKLLPILATETPEQFYQSTHTPEQMDRAYASKASVLMTIYLNHSYWNQPLAMNERPVCPDQGDGMSYYFWQMRNQFGKDFTDRLAVYVLRAAMDKPHTDNAENYKQYFYERLKVADSVIDNENSRMPAIDAILAKCGWLNKGTKK